MDYMMNGKANPTSLIFIGKNLWQYRDETQVVVTPNNPLENEDPDEVRRRYLNALPDTTES